MDRLIHPVGRRNVMLIRCLCALGVFTCAAALFGAEEEKPLTPVEARKKIGSKIVVRMEVKAAKDRLEKRGEVYLDSEADFKSKKNFAVVITKKGAASLKEGGIADPADHYRGKTIRATGTVKKVDGIPRIEIDEAKQLEVVEK
jgi:DNA/RNA endonuclease YhcR with UshA esterase domain